MTTRTNARRRLAMIQAITAPYQAANPSCSTRENLIDLITDLLHLATAYGHDAEGVCFMARMHQEEEKTFPELEDPRP